MVIGLLAMALAFLCQLIGTRLFQMSMTVINVTGAPLLALFFMGIFLPYINAWVSTAVLAIYKLFMSL